MIIAITDDGRGIDPKKVLAKATAKGIVKEAQAKEMTEREIVNLVFAPGFSTAETVSDISGRGVGMDVVRSNTEKLGGHVELETQAGVGTTVLLRLPLTLAIIPSMIVGVGGNRFAIPQVNVVEFVWVRAADVARRIERVHGAEVLRLRTRILPLVRLADMLGIPGPTWKGHPGNGCRTAGNAGGPAHPAGARAGPSRAPPEPIVEQPKEPTPRKGKKASKKAPPVEVAPPRGQDRRADWRSDYNIVVLRLGSNQFGVVVDELLRHRGDRGQAALGVRAELQELLRRHHHGRRPGDHDPGRRRPGDPGPPALRRPPGGGEAAQRGGEAQGRAGRLQAPLGDRLHRRAGRILRHPPGPDHAAGEDPDLGHPDGGRPPLRRLPRATACR